MAAARERIADAAVHEDVIGQVLVHILEHPFAQRPLIAQAIRDLAPWTARDAAGRLRNWISDPRQSPESVSAPGRGPEDMLG